MPRNRWQLHDICQSLDTVLFSAFVQIYIWDGSLLALVLRSVSQIQFGVPIHLHPDRSLRFFGISCLVLNALSTLVHCLGPVRPNRKGLLLDLIGQEYVPNRAQVLLLDLIICAVQLLFVVLSYDYAHPPSNVGEDVNDREDAADDIGIGLDHDGTS